MLKNINLATSSIHLMDQTAKKYTQNTKYVPTSIVCRVQYKITGPKTSLMWIV